jgi:hypothetical protein
MPAKHSTQTDRDQLLREHLLELLKGGGAHVTFDAAVADLPAKLYGAKAPNQPHTPWRLIEHMRIAQWDILEFIRNPAHQSPSWPDGYWPSGDAPAKSSDWNTSIRQFRKDLSALQDLVSDPSRELLVPLPHGQGQTLAREAMLAADHNAYHLGQLVLLRRALDTWQD